MASERPHYLPPLTVRADGDGGVDSDRELDPAYVPLPRTASSVNSNQNIGLARSVSTARTPHTGTGHAPRSPSAYSATFTLSSSTGAQNHSVSSPPPASSTHAGGILPSASFFHPSRPTFYNDFGPISNFNAGPLSSVPRSTALDPRPESAGSDSFVQGSFSTDELRLNSSGRERAGPTHGANTTVGTSALSRTFSTKVSREPLLPIGQKPKPLASTRPTNGTASGHKIPGVGGNGLRREGSGGKGSQSGVGVGASAGGRVRTSLEKFLRRTLSGDAQASDISLNKGSRLVANMEDLESQGRDSEEPYIEFKSMPFDEEGTMNITHTANVSSSVSRRKRTSPFQPRFPDFNPIAPSVDPPASRTPILNASGRLLQKYRLHPSRNSFFLKGWILTGGDSVSPFIGSVILVLGIAGTWSGTTAVWWWKHESPAVAIVGGYLCLLTIANMMATAFSDPGILPRNLDPDPPYPNTASSGDSVRAPLPRDLKVRSGVVRVKYCQTCRIYRPPRSSHCRMCDNCVDGCDHHCQWVNNCVGRRNYTSFILFLTSAALTLCLVICTSALHLVIQAHQEHMDAKASLRRGAGSAVVFVLSAIVIWPVGGLLGYHMRLLLLNLTTIEQIRNSAHKSLVNGPPPPNPFALGSWRHNLAEMLCRAQGMSWLAATEYATEDKREPNPGTEML